jgi:hypothetical protein
MISSRSAIGEKDQWTFEGSIANSHDVKMRPSFAHTEEQNSPVDKATQSTETNELNSPTQKRVLDAIVDAPFSVVHCK